MSNVSLLSGDLNYILEAMGPGWEELRNQHIFMTGGTGFFGCWFLESFIWANQRFNLKANLTVLTRNMNRFKHHYPHLSQHDFIHFYAGDVKNFIFPPGNYSHIIHAATDVTSLDNASALDTFTTITHGTARVLEFAKQCGAKNFLLISSGAIYGEQPVASPGLAEEYIGHPRLEEARSAYGIGKYTAEHLCHLYSQAHHIPVKIARCFTFIGPYLSLNSPLAVSHFLKAAMQDQPIIIQSDGSARRSYLYTADLMVWLWKILFYGKSLRPYNVGSDQAVSIAQLAQLIANCYSPSREVITLNNPSHGLSAQNYIPDITRAQTELQLSQKTTLTQAIQSTLKWYRTSL